MKESCMDERVGSRLLLVPSSTLERGGRRAHRERGAIHRVPVRSLLPADSPRSAGEDLQHVRRLAAGETRLPPILVHRPTMRVIDGMHRLRVAQQLGQDQIDVQFFEGSAQDAFVVAVQSNVAHGLPLTLSDRTSAARRIIAAFPSWSDRKIAAVAGLSGGTVGALRLRAAAAGSAEPGGRIGLDGRRRPVDAAARRLTASKIVSQRPGASLREIAREAGISLATARDVRSRVQRGEDPLPAIQRSGKRPLTAESPARRPDPGEVRSLEFSDRNRAQQTRDAGEQNLSALLQGLANDPSLRFTESGRSLLRWLSLRSTGLSQWSDIADTVPPHCTYIVADLARRCADEWASFAAQIEKQTELMA
jgi:ParB-like chromosome segregation protein Spo0J